MILKKIQDRLLELYRLKTGHNVEDFAAPVLEDDANATVVQSRLGQEALIVRQSGQHLELALFVDPAVLNNLEREDPFSFLGRHNLKAFCTAVEGVSHFLYLVLHAEENRPVTQLELELQAEVDKYLLAALLFEKHHAEVPEFLFGFLFENIAWAPHLNPAEMLRYQKANHLAARFCRFLESDCIRRGRWHAALETARRFWHLNHWSKLRHLTP